MDKTPLLSIIIPAYDNPEDLAPLLDSISKYANSSIEVWVIDDGSNPPLEQIVSPYRFNYHYQQNSGPAVARNKGARLSGGEAIFFLDSDTVLLPDTLLKVLDIIKEPGFKIGSIPYYQKSINPGYAPEFKGLFDAYHVWHNRPRGMTASINGSSALFRKDVFFEIGGWDESFKTPDMEHEEFSVRIKRKYPIILYPDVFVYHRFPGFRKLLVTIFSRSVSWTRLKIRNKVEFDDITRTKPKAFIALLPLFILLISFLGIFKHSLLWLWVPSVALYIIGNIGFYAFLLKNSSLPKLFIYIIIHYIFLLSVGLGAIFSGLTFWKSLKAEERCVKKL